jgi:hypothetical protein
MEEIRGKLESRGARLYAIGNGNSLMARDFVEQFDIQFGVYTDPSLSTYKAMDFKRKIGIGLSSIRSGFRAARMGHTQGKVQGDPWQQGGEAIFSRQGTLIWSRTSPSAGDHSSPVEVLKALDLL